VIADVHTDIKTTVRTVFFYFNLECAAKYVTHSLCTLPCNCTHTAGCEVNDTHSRIRDSFSKELYLTVGYAIVLFLVVKN
jgi:hypothetical protein